MFNKFNSCASVLGPASLPLPRLLSAINCISGNGRTPQVNGSEKGNSLTRHKTTGSEYRVDRVQGQSQLDLGSQRNLRVALYSHDTMGLGHLRRNLVIAAALAESHLSATSLLITGAHEANFFSLPARADFLTLPRLHKNAAGAYSAGKLDISIDDLITLRADSICSALSSFRPDVLIVDKVPLGAFGELLPALKVLRKRSNVKCVLGIRDVLDDPQTVRADSDSWIVQDAIDKFYDDIWIYGDQRVYDPIQEYNWPKSVAAKVKFTGYLDQSSRLSTLEEAPVLFPAKKGAADQRLIVCTLGGGQDGFPLAKAFVESLPAKGVSGVLLTGPFMPKPETAHINQIAAKCPQLVVKEFSSEADYLISRADSVVTMGGYNSVCSVLSFGKRALVVPRVSPRLEQWIRAERLSRLGVIDVLHPDQLNTSALHDWMTQTAAYQTQPSEIVDMQGLLRLEQYCANLLSRPRQPHKSISLEAS